MKKIPAESDNKLRNELLLLVALKLLLLAAIWWLFFQAQGVSVDPITVGRHVTTDIPNIRTEIKRDY